MNGAAIWMGKNVELKSSRTWKELFFVLRDEDVDLVPGDLLNLTNFN